MPALSFHSRAMIRIRALGTLLLVTFLVALPTGAGAVQADKAKPKHVFLWSVKGKGCTAFLLGSLHASTRGLYPLDDRILKAYASCPRGVFEADINEAGSAKAREMM
ncbi:MAG TPA: TraB/GumN family protein, partial [Deltaproteobacteria bacterium]|nr:TraB/GumN family protein [Deltaproteobacteria bacterium]